VYVQIFLTDQCVSNNCVGQQVTIGQLTEICRRQRRGSRKPPWIEDEEDRRFTGYESVQEALDAMDVDCKKVRGRA